MKRILLIFGGMLLLYWLIFVTVEEWDRSAMIKLARLRAEAAAGRYELTGSVAPVSGVTLGSAPDSVVVRVGTLEISAPIPHGRAGVHGYLGNGPVEGTLWILLLIVMVLVACDLAARQIARPLRELAEGAERLAEGTPGPPLPEGEFASLARTFNQMSALITRRDAELKAEHESTARAALLKSRLLEQSYAEMRETLLAMQPENEAMQRNIQSMLGLVEDLQQAAWLEQGALDVELEPVDLAAEVDAVRELMAPTLNASLPALPRVQADPARLRQVLVNLLGNALKFGQGNVEVRARLEAETVLLEIEDRGPGIAPEALPRVFEEFRQADERVHQRYGGAGLGLSISRRLAELQGGRVELDSRPGQGTIARLVLRVSS